MRARCESVMADTNPPGLFRCELDIGHASPHRAALPDVASSDDGAAMWTDAGGVARTLDQLMEER